MKKTLAVVAIGALILLAGCSGGPGDQFQKSGAPEEPAVTQPEAQPEETIAPVAEVIEHQWTQDLWLFNAVRYYTVAGTEVDATGALPTYMDKWDPAQTFEVAEGVVFDTYDELKPSIVGVDGVARSDVNVLAGMLTFDDEQVFAVLATPDAQAAAPIGMSDFVEVDFTFLGENFYPGIPMAFDFSFLQTIPGAEGETDGPFELLKNRINSGQVNFYGTESAGGPELLMFTNAMGVAVEGSSRMQMSGKGKISDPGMKGFRDGVWSARKGGVGGVRGYFNKFSKGAKGSNALIRCNLGGLCGDPPQWTPPPGQVCIGYSCGNVSGDPHLQTFDGLGYSPQAVGEMVLVESEGLRVQMRTAPWGSSTSVSILTGIAVEAAGQQFMVAIHEGKPQLFINTKLVPLGDLPQEINVGDVAVTGSKDRVQLVTKTGERVTVMLRAGQLAVFVDSGTLAGMTGMLGNANGPVEDDLATRDGVPVAQDLATTDPAAFYSTFVNSWRITQEESLFHYLPGQNTDHFTDLDFPSEYLSLDSIPANELNRARAVCTQAGIGQQSFLNNCIFDYWASQSMEFVTAAQQMDLLDGVSSGFYQLEDEPEPNAGGGGEIPEGHGPEEGQSVEDFVLAQWRWTPHSRYTEGHEFQHFCPAGGTADGQIWGGGLQGYTSDSSVCASAVHQGLITAQAGGLVSVSMVAGQETYETLPAANGVEPIEWFRSWSYGYVFK